MEFTFTPEEERFRHELRAFLAAQLPADWSERDFLGDVSRDEQRGVDDAVTRALAGKGWLALPWAKQYGGLGAGHVQQAIYTEETAYTRMPGGGGAGVASVGPSIQRFGSRAQQEQYLPRIAAGLDRWCTLTVEDDAGSDVAAMQTRAVRDGDEYVISGAKTWVSGAERATYGLLAARTDAKGAPQDGISTIIVPMDAPGVTVRPLDTLAGERDLSEVIFEDVRVPVQHMVGRENAGWYQMQTASDLERSGVGAISTAKANIERLVEAARDDDSLIGRNPSARYELADRWIEIQVGFNVSYRVPHLQAQGQQPDQEAREARLYGSELTQRVANTGMHLLGLAAQAAPGSRYAKLAGAFSQEYLRATAATVAGGTSEIQRNLIAQRGLGLPRD